MIIDDIVRTKTDGIENSPAEIEAIITAYSVGSINDSELTPWLKAVYRYGMSDEETFALVNAMIESGERLDFSHLSNRVVDKHSTGGVGDKVSLVLTPILAACGAAVPMIAGRSLGHTGGTLDKLESIPGYKVDLPLPQFQDIVEKVGLSIIGQTKEICPADKKIYSLRDKTNTIVSIPLICGSIMSKKIAEGVNALAMNITIGNGAFMKSLDEGKGLGEKLKLVGEKFGIKTSVVYSTMDQPLGRKAGLWNEVQEAVACLKGEGEKDVMELVTQLATTLLRDNDSSAPEKKVKEAIESGAALQKLEALVESHEGDASLLHSSKNVHPPRYEQQVVADRTGFIADMDTEFIGRSVNLLTIFEDGGTRHLDPSGGVRFEKKVGDEVRDGKTMAICFGSNQDRVELSARRIYSAVVISDTPKEPPPVIL
mgnify:CR=1 FL=1|tara:strand:+ start:40265 stop:41545 length:1281 start_codon:yes stop_codon:yes gene_type:complete